MQLTYFPRRSTDRPRRFFPTAFASASLVRIRQSVSLPFSPFLSNASRVGPRSSGLPKGRALTGLKSRGEILARVLSFCESSSYKDSRVSCPPPLSCDSDAIGIQKIGLALELVPQPRFSFFSLVPHPYNAISTCMHA